MKGVIDTSTIDTLRNYKDESGQSLLVSLVNIFSDVAPKQVRELRVLFESSDFDRLERAAHSLKSTCGNLGITRMSDACAEIENHILDVGVEKVDKGQIGEWIKIIEETFSPALNDLKQLI